jgi:predicted  nucleic acid-binding Zn-ribbon protein
MSPVCPRCGNLVDHPVLLPFRVGGGAHRALKQACPDCGCRLFPFVREMEETRGKKR